MSPMDDTQERFDDCVTALWDANQRVVRYYGLFSRLVSTDGGLHSDGTQRWYEITREDYMALKHDGAAVGGLVDALDDIAVAIADAAGATASD